MPGARQTSSGGEQLEPWEKRLIKTVAADYRTLDPEDLAADLAWRLLVLKRGRKPTIRNWPAYVRKSLRNKALNWIKKNRSREEKTTSLDATINADDETGNTLVDVLRSTDPDAERSLALKQALASLPSELHAALTILIEENWNQIAAGRRLHKHRNTIRVWIARIRGTLALHGFRPGADSENAYGSTATDINPRGRIPQNRRAVAIACSVLKRFSELHLSGAEWRLALWVLHRTWERKQRMIGLRWRGIAKELRMDHRGIRRSAIRLLRRRILITETSRIGLERNVRYWQSAPRKASRCSPKRSGDEKQRFRFGNRPFPSACSDFPARVPISTMKDSKRYVRIPTRFLDALLRARLSGIQWSILCWVIRRTTALKADMTPFSWYWIAVELALDRAGVVRAGRQLLRIGILRRRGGAIGIRSQEKT